MTEPSWLPEAQGALVASALLGLPAVVWKHQNRWVRGSAGVAWIFLAGLVSYYSIAGDLLRFVPGPIIWAASAWRPLAVGVAIGSGAGFLFGRRFQLLVAPRVPAVVVPQQTP